MSVLGLKTARGPGCTKPEASYDQLLVRFERLSQASSPDRKSSVRSTAARFKIVWCRSFKRSATTSLTCPFGSDGSECREGSEVTDGSECSDGSGLAFILSFGSAGPTTRANRIGNKTVTIFRSVGAFRQASRSQCQD